MCWACSRVKLAGIGMGTLVAGIAPVATAFIFDGDVMISYARLRLTMLRSSPEEGGGGAEGA